MANTRIKDLTNTAVTVPSDAYVAIDGSANGTAKISRDDLRQDTADAIAAAPSTYNLAPLTSGSVDVDKGGTGSTTVAGAKTNLEVPDVGTAANEVSVNGMLGDLAFQSSDGPSVSNLKASGTTTLTNDSDIALAVETNNQNAMTVNVIGTSPNYIFDVRDDGTSKFRIDSSGNVSIGSSTIGSSSTTISGTSAFTLDVYRPATGYTNAAFLSFDLNNDAAERTSYALIGGRIVDDTDGSESGELVFRTKDSGGALTTRWSVSPAGNLVSSGGGIDFGSAAASGRTVESGLLNDFERGTATPTDASGAGLTLTQVGLNYVKIGSQVTAWVKVTYPTTSDTSTATIGNLPFAFGSSNIDRIGGFVAYQNTGLDVSVLGTNGTGQVTFRNNSGTSYTNAQLSAKVIYFCVTYDVS